MSKVPQITIVFLTFLLLLAECRSNRQQLQRQKSKFDNGLDLQVCSSSDQTCLIKAAVFGQSRNINKSIKVEKQEVSKVDEVKAPILQAKFQNMLVQVSQKPDCEVNELANDSNMTFNEEIYLDESLLSEDWEIFTYIESLISMLGKENNANNFMKQRGFT